MADIRVVVLKEVKDGELRGKKQGEIVLVNPQRAHTLRQQEVVCLYSDFQPQMLKKEEEPQVEKEPEGEEPKEEEKKVIRSGARKAARTETPEE